MSDCVQCAATMCPLIAKDGSPWTGTKDAPCPEKGGMDDGGCPWWDMACSVGGIQRQVDEAASHEGRAAVIGPNKPRRGTSTSREYDCPKAAICSWQRQAEKVGRSLCPPRDALARGLDPRVCLF